MPSFRQGGAGFYTATLLDGLSRRQDVELDALLSAELGAELEDLAPAVRGTVLRSTRQGGAHKAANYLVAARRPYTLNLGFIPPLRDDRSDVVHWPISFMNGPRPKRSSRRILTVLDIQHEFFPQFFSRRDRALRRLRWRPSVRAADHVIAISEFTRRTLCDRYEVPENRVTVVPLCCRTAFVRDDEPTGIELPSELKGVGTWFFYPASPLGAKNHARLLEAFALHLARVDPDARLVLAGPHMHEWRWVRELIASLGLNHAVILLGSVDDPMLRRLYSASTGLIFPSLFEGFGLPVLEAMASGCPVATSDAGSLPEVVGEAGFVFDPHDAEAIAAGLAYLAALAPSDRATVANAGRAQADRFRPEYMIDGTVSVYAEALG